MEMSNFTSPLQAVQMISMFSYLNTLSDFLFVEKYLDETNLHQPIPIVNALYRYLYLDKLAKVHGYSVSFSVNEKKRMEKRKRQLARKLIAGSDLFGAKENENLDEIFIDSLYKHIITTVVFEKYTNIYGFLAEMVRTSEDEQVFEIQDDIRIILSEEIFLEENGQESQLDILAICKIIEDFIHPLLPNPEKEMSFITVDYVYAQAGSIFLNSATTPKLLTPTLYKHNENFDSNDQLNNYIATAHAVEQSVSAGKMDKSALSVFALPALLHYVFKHKQELKSQSIANIMNNSTIGTEMYKMLFTYLNESFEAIEKVKENDYRYQFYLAMSNFKNRTTLARENIRRKCQFIKEETLKDEVLNYKNNHDSYQCITRNNRRETLEDINRLYQEQMDIVTKKYFTYEKESIREIFGADLLKSFDARKVEISRGLLKGVYDGYSAYETQLLRDSDDLFWFYFPDNNTSVYYAILRSDSNMEIIQEANDANSDCSVISTGSSSTPFPVDGRVKNSNYFASPITSRPFDTAAPSFNSAKTSRSKVIRCTPEALRAKLELHSDQKFRNNFFPTVNKEKDDLFDDFLTEIVTKRAGNFNESLFLEKYDQTRKEWWKEFGLSFIPFHTCRHGIRTKNVDEAELACSLDILFFIPLFGEVGYIAERLTTTVTKSALSVVGTTFGSLALRMTMRETMEKLGTVLISEGIKFSALFTEETFKSLGLNILRTFDPGFELIYKIGKKGLSTIIISIKAIQKYSISFQSLEMALYETENKLLNSLVKKVDTLSEKNVFVNSLSPTSDSGYGYKFIQLDHQVAQIRSVEEYSERIPVVLYREAETNNIICKAINSKTGEIQNKVLHLQDAYLFRSEAKPAVIHIESVHDLQMCGISRGKRSPDKINCRIIHSRRRELMIKNAIDFAVVNGVPEGIVRQQLRRFIFPEESPLSLKLVREWIDSIRKGETEFKLPAWSKEYEIQNPELYEELMYADSIDVPSISEDAARSASISTRSFNLPNKLEVFRRAFNVYKVHNFATFEDYLSINNFLHTGYQRINLYTHEALAMQRALNRLAIRQSIDSLPEFASVLYRAEVSSREVVNRCFFSAGSQSRIGKNIEINKFMSTSPNLHITKQDIINTPLVRNNPTMEYVLYEIKFEEHQPYFRAKVKKDEGEVIKEVHILLPGSKFYVQDATRITDESGNTFAKIQLKFNYDEIPRHGWYIKTLNELKSIDRRLANPF